MRKELDDKLVQAFPNLYKDRRKDMRQTAMCWGFQCGDGWFKLIWDLSKKLEELILKEPPDVQQHLGASTVKEKFGRLCFYLSAGTDEMYEITHKAENESGKICEECGTLWTTKRRGGSWIYTLCFRCYWSMRVRRWFNYGLRYRVINFFRILRKKR